MKERPLTTATLGGGGQEVRGRCLPGGGDHHARQKRVIVRGPKPCALELDFGSVLVVRAKGWCKNLESVF